MLLLANVVAHCWQQVCQGDMHAGHCHCGGGSGNVSHCHKGAHNHCQPTHKNTTHSNTLAMQWRALARAQATVGLLEMHTYCMLV